MKINKSLKKVAKGLTRAVSGVGSSVRGVYRTEIRGSGKYIAKEIRNITKKKKLFPYKRAKYKKKTFKEIAKSLGY